MRLGRNHEPVLLYILHSGNLYGTERMALATLDGLNEYHRRVVFAPAPGSVGSVRDAALAAGHHSVSFQSRLGLLTALLPWFLRYRSIDVIGTGVVHSALCHLLGKIFRVRVRQLHVAHGGTPASFDRKHELNRLPVTVVAVSEFVRAQLIERGVRPVAITVIENFLSVEQVRERVCRPAYVTKGTAGRTLERALVRVAIVSRVDAIKRIDLLVRAVELHGLAQFQFDIFGTGTDLDLLRDRSARLSNIRFHGFVADVKERLAEADLFLHLCPEEPFGLVILEAFLAQLVVIVPDGGGAGSLVEDGVNGLKFVADDVEDLCRVLKMAADLSSEELQRLADTAVKALEGRFGQAEGVRRYRSALQKGAPSGAAGTA